MKRIVITGAECTGKTTLAKALSGYYGAPWSAEFVREFAAGLNRPIEQTDLEAIAVGQLATEDSAAEQAEAIVLHDTNLLSSILYAKHYFDTEIGWVKEHFLARDYALYLLCTPDGIEWEADPGQRESPEARDTLHLRFEESLEKLRLPYVTLKGPAEARFGEAILEINKLMEG